jgi:3-dehydroquinate dehydratase / shikimate dehydrogenase
MLPMICTVVKGPGLALVKDQMERAKLCSDLVELRLDLMNVTDEEVKELVSSYPIPCIFTLRRKEGEQEEVRLSRLEAFAHLKPAFFDLEEDIPLPFIHKLQKKHPEIKWILSFHDWDKTPDDLDAIYHRMKKIPADYYKIAVRSDSSLDTVKMVQFQAHAPKNVIGISMGEKGTVSRIMAKPFTYACLDDDLQTAPGQFTAKDLSTLYRYGSISPSTCYYALLGTPITKSISHLTHNAAMKAFEWDARYLKIEVAPEELEKFLANVRDLPFKGFSVTMPLKEVIYPFLDEIHIEAQKIGSVNTVVCKEGKYVGYNTDGIGALNAIEDTLPVKNKKLIILGAGGAAKGIAFEAKKRGAEVLILNRTVDRAQIVADQIGCSAGSLDTIVDLPYDILVNATSTLPIDPKQILSTAIVMDINTLPKYSPLLLCAKEKGCSLVFGHQMFAYQAAEQYALWFPSVNKAEITKFLLDRSCSCV